MATKFVLALVLVAAMMCGTLANDVPVKFCAKDCNGTALAHYTVQLSGCTDRPATCMTGVDGCCTIERSPDVIQYCYGSATYLCQWSILSGYMGNMNTDRRHLLAAVSMPSATLMNPVDPFIPDTPTFVKYGNQVTPRQFSGCQCNGKDYCAPVIYNEGDSTPYTVTFTPKSCSCSQVISGPVFNDSIAPLSTPNRKLM